MDHYRRVFGVDQAAFCVNFWGSGLRSSQLLFPQAMTEGSQDEIYISNAAALSYRLNELLLA